MLAVRTIDESGRIGLSEESRSQRPPLTTGKGVEGSAQAFAVPLALNHPEPDPQQPLPPALPVTHEDPPQAQPISPPLLREDSEFDRPAGLPALPGPDPQAPSQRLEVQTPPAGAIGKLMQDALASLQVGAAPSGGQQVHMEIRADFLPGVRVVLQELNGRIQVDFICSVEGSWLALGAVARREANELARRCKRDVLLRIHAEDDERQPAFDLLETLGTA